MRKDKGTTVMTAYSERHKGFVGIAYAICQVSDDMLASCRDEEDGPLPTYYVAGGDIGGTRHYLYFADDCLPV